MSSSQVHTKYYVFRPQQIWPPALFINLYTKYYKISAGHNKYVLQPSIHTLYFISSALYQYIHYPAGTPLGIHTIYSNYWLKSDGLVDLPKFQVFQVIMVKWKTQVGCDVEKTWFSGCSCDMIVVLLLQPKIRRVFHVIMVTWKTRVGCDMEMTWFSGCSCDMIVVLLLQPKFHVFST